MKRSNHASVVRLTSLALLAALVVVLQTVASGIRIGPVPISLTLVPIVVGAILFGPGAGAGLGAVFGVVCLIAGITGADEFTNVLWVASPFWLVVVCVGKAVLCGLCAGLVAKALRQRQTLSCILAALTAPVVNTGVFAIGMLTVFKPVLQDYAGGTNIVYFLFVAVIGVNIGDCVTTAIVCSIGSKADAKRTGVVHIIFNLCASVIIITALTVLHHAGALDGLWGQTMTSGAIANVHTIFRLSTAVLLLPVCGQFEKISRVLVKDDQQIGENVDHELSQLDEKFFASPALALSAASDAISAMARLARTGVMSALDVLHHFDRHTIDVIDRNEDHIDALADSVDNYLIKLSSHVPPGHGNDLLNYYIQCFSEFERIGDYAVNLTENAEELRSKGIEFSETAQQELQVLGEALREIMDYAYRSFTAVDAQTARRIEPVEEVVDDMVATLRTNHIRRLRDGQCTVYAGLVFLDILINAERIADQCSNLGVYTISQFDPSVMNSHHEYIHRLHQGNDPVFNREYQEKHEKYFGMLSAIND